MFGIKPSTKRLAPVSMFPLCLPRVEVFENPFRLEMERLRVIVPVQTA